MKGTSIYVGNTVLKIILLRVAAGREKDVVKILEQYVEDERSKNGNIIEHAFFKTLGMYDIMLMLHCKQFEQGLLTKGTIQYIIHSNEILCFPLHMSPSEFKLKLHFKSAVFMSLLKFRSEPLLEFGQSLETVLTEYIGNLKNLIVLGGLGWNELVTIRWHNFEASELEDIFENFLRRTRALGLKEGNIFHPLSHKIYSQIGINYNVIKRLGKEFVEEFGEDKRGPRPRLLISVAEPHFETVLNSIPEIFKGLEFGSPQLMTGVHDISLTFKRGKWGDFLDRLLRFRDRHKEAILDTRTEMTSPIEFGKASRVKKSKKYTFPKLKVGEVETNKILDRPGSSHLVSTLYRFNNFFQNPTLQDSLLDLYIPADKLITLALSKDEAGKYREDNKAINILLNDFQWAIRERVMGAYLFTEEDEHSFSPIRGGLQKILLALASIPFSLMNELSDRSIKWQGYMSIGMKSEPLHFFENLHVPFEHALYPDKYWWCCIHEIGHIFTLVSGVLKREHECMKEALTKWGDGFDNMADNCIADLFDFIIGFLGNRRLYSEVYWSFLLDNIRTQDVPQQFVERHMTRQFFGWVFEKKYLSMDKLQIGSGKDLVAEAGKFIGSIQVRKDIKKRLHFYMDDDLRRRIADGSLPYLGLFEHVRHYISPLISLQKKLKAEYKSERFNHLISSIVERGEVGDCKLIKYPHLIPLKMMESSRTQNSSGGAIITVRARIAAILTLFWYSYSNLLPWVLTTYKEKVRNR